MGGVGRGEMAERSEGDGTARVEREDDPPYGFSLAPDYLRRILRLEALPDNTSGTDKSWVHRAHADAIHHLRSAKRR